MIRLLLLELVRGHVPARSLPVWCLVLVYAAAPWLALTQAVLFTITGSPAAAIVFGSAAGYLFAFAPDFRDRHGRDA